MVAKTIQKYQKKSVPSLIATAVRYFHAYIRNRDKGKVCVSCGVYTTLEAGHFYSGGHYPILRFDPLNVHGQCKRCNSHLHGNLNEYRKRITSRITPEQLSVLDLKSDQYKKTGFKWDRLLLIDIIEKYKNLNKQ